MSNRFKLTGIKTLFLSAALFSSVMTADALAEQAKLSFLAAEYSAASLPFWEKQVAAFEKANPDIDVTLEVVGWSAMHDTTAQRIAANQMPDLVNTATIWVPEWAGADAIQALGPDLASDAFKAGFVPALFEKGAEYNGKTWGLPIAAAARALLMDEPLSNLDTQLRAGTRAELLRLHQRLQTTTVYVTHDQVEAMTLADIIVVMRDGKIEQAGSPLDVFEKPVNTFVATFIGSPPMNLLPAVIKSTRDSNLALGAGFTFPLGKLRQEYEGRSVKIGIRPRDFSLSKAAGALQGTVQLIEPTGDECYVHVVAGGVRFLVSIPGRPQIHVGDTVGFMVKKGSTHVFDAITDTRLI